MPTNHGFDPKWCTADFVYRKYLRLKVQEMGRRRHAGIGKGEV